MDKPIRNQFARARWLVAVVASLTFGAGGSFAQRPASTGKVNPQLYSCSPLPPIDPAKDFIGNFNNHCYATVLATSTGQNAAGDTNAHYDSFYYQVTPGYELIVTGIFPNARFFSATVYDEHSAQTSELIDYQILPLYSGMTNPFVAGTVFAPNQQYAMTVGFGGVPTTISAGCSTSGSTVDQNFMDSSQIHQGLTWTGYPGLPKNFPPHQTGANDAGAVIIRRYVDISSTTLPQVIVRQLSNGCAISAADAVSQNIISVITSVGSAWRNSSQIYYHQDFADDVQPTYCYPADPTNQANWKRGPDYVPGNDNDAGYLKFQIDPSTVQSLISGGKFIRMQFQVPTTPNTPCTTGNCFITGNEQLRYRSISFQNQNYPLISLKDADFVKDPNGYVTLIIGMGAQPPSYVTAANYYTYFDLSTIKNYTLLSSVNMRDILPNIAFNCSNFNVPYKTTETNPEGGFMGNYIPTVDFPSASKLPTVPVPVVRANSCSAIPTETPVSCGQ